MKREAISGRMLPNKVSIIKLYFKLSSNYKPIFSLFRRNIINIVARGRNSIQNLKRTLRIVMSIVPIANQFFSQFSRLSAEYDARTSFLVSFLVIFCKIIIWNWGASELKTFSFRQAKAPAPSHRMDLVDHFGSRVL